MTRIDALYHWSPRARRASIERSGLLPGQRSNITIGDPDLADEQWRAPYVCFATTPSLAWGLSGRIIGELGQTWDLWMVRLEPGDEVHVLPFYGPDVQEVRVANRIAKSRVWWVGERTVTKTRGPNR